MADNKRKATYINDKQSSEKNLFAIAYSLEGFMDIIEDVQKKAGGKEKFTNAIIDSLTGIQGNQKGSDKSSKKEKEETSNKSAMGCLSITETVKALKDFDEIKNTDKFINFLTKINDEIIRVTNLVKDSKSVGAYTNLIDSLANNILKLSTDLLKATIPMAFYLKISGGGKKPEDSILYRFFDSILKSLKRVATNKEMLSIDLTIKYLTSSIGRIVKVATMLTLLAPLLLAALPGVLLLKPIIWGIGLILLMSPLNPIVAKQFSLSIMLVSAGLLTLGASLIFWNFVKLTSATLALTTLMALTQVMLLLSKATTSISIGASGVALMSLSVIALGIGFLFWRGVRIIDVTTAMLSLLALTHITLILNKSLPSIITGAMAVGLMSLSVIVLGLGFLFWKFVDYKSVVFSLLTLSALTFLTLKLSAVSKGALTGATVIIALSSSIFILGLGLLFWKFVDVKSVGFALATISALTLLTHLLSDKKIKQGALGLIAISTSIFITGLGLLLWGNVNVESTIFALTTIATLTVLTRLLSDKNIKSGAMGLMLVSASVIVLSIGMNMWKNVNVTLKDIMLLGTTIGGLIFGLKLIDKFKNAKQSSMTLIIASASIFVLSLAMKIWKNTNVEFKDVATLSGTIFALVGALFFIGKVQGSIIKGSLALGIVSLAVIGLGYGMSLWMKNPPKLEDIGNLSLLIGVLSGIALTMGMPPVSLVAASGAGVLVLMGGAIALLGIGMNDFMRANVNEEAINNVKKLINTLFTVFSENFTLKKMASVMFGGAALSNMSSTLSGLAKGIQSMAKLSFSEYKYDKKTGKLVEVGRVTLKDEDFAKVGENTAKLISVLGESFAKVGKKDGLLGLIGMGDVSRGVSVVQGYGNSLNSLAKGVQSWANMQVIEWGIQKDPKTGLNKLVPLRSKTITKKDIENAGSNITDVITGLMIPLNILGGANPPEGSLPSRILQRLSWAKTNKEKGLDVLTGVSGSLYNLSKGVQAWASGKYLKYKITTNKDGVRVIEPDEYDELPDLKVVGGRIGDLITSLIEPLAKLGDANSNWYGWGTGDIDKGVNVMKGISDSLTNFASIVDVWASGEYIQMDIQKDPNTGLNILTPKVRKALPSVADAEEHITRLISGFITPLINLSKTSSEEDANASLKIISTLSTGVSKISEGINTIYSIDGETLSKNSTTYITVLKSILELFDSKKNVTIISTNNNIRKFANSFKNLVDPIEKLSKSIDKVTKPMTDLTKVFDKKNEGVIKSFDNWTKSIVELSKIDENKFKTNWSLINNTFDKGVDSVSKKTSKPKTFIHQTKDDKTNKLVQNNKQNDIQKEIVEKKKSDELLNKNQQQYAQSEAQTNVLNQILMSINELNSKVNMISNSPKLKI